MFLSTSSSFHPINKTAQKYNSNNSINHFSKTSNFESNNEHYNPTFSNVINDKNLNKSTFNQYSEAKRVPYVVNTGSNKFALQNHNIQSYKPFNDQKLKFFQNNQQNIENNNEQTNQSNVNYALPSDALQSNIKFQQYHIYDDTPGMPLTLNEINEESKKSLNMKNNTENCDKNLNLQQNNNNLQQFVGSPIASVYNHYNSNTKLSNTINDCSSNLLLETTNKASLISKFNTESDEEEDSELKMVIRI